MRPIGFSTGAVALADFRRGVQVLASKGVPVVELSALRHGELAPLLEGIDRLNLEAFAFVSVHAPSAFAEDQEELIIDALAALRPRRWPIVLHPDAAYRLDRWNVLGELLAIENMDRRKTTGRTAHELGEIFAVLPAASLCFDIAHARQVDSSMTESYRILRNFGERILQVHLSEVNSASRHDRISEGALLAYREISWMIRDDVPIILESPVGEEDIEREIRRARLALPNHIENAELLPGAVPAI